MLAKRCAFSVITVKKHLCILTSQWIRNYEIAGHFYAVIAYVYVFKNRRLQISSSNGMIKLFRNVLLAAFRYNRMVTPLAPSPWSAVSSATPLLHGRGLAASWRFTSNLSP
jgi:hypothetical protein